MTRTAIGAAMALTIFSSGAALATTPAFQDNKLNFKGCDGEQTSVRWQDDSFLLSAAGKSFGKGFASFESTDWDGKCQKVTWDNGQAKFAIGADGKTSTSSLVRFTAVDGSRWVAMRYGDGFFVSRVAAGDEKPSQARMLEIAAWLERTSQQYGPGIHLAKHLKAATID